MATAPNAVSSSMPAGCPAAEVKLQTQFLPRYFRNARRNIQCFPSCSEHGNYEVVFLEDKKHASICRGAVIVNLSFSPPFTSENVLVVGRFCPVPDDAPVDVVKLVTKGIKGHCKCRNTDGSYCYDVCPTSSWKFEDSLANKRRAKQLKALYVFAVTALANVDGSMRPIGECKSTPFELNSTRTLSRLKKSMGGGNKRPLTPDATTVDAANLPLTRSRKRPRVSKTPPPDESPSSPASATGAEFDNSADERKNGSPGFVFTVPPHWDKVKPSGGALHTTASAPSLRSLASWPQMTPLDQFPPTLIRERSLSNASSVSAGSAHPSLTMDLDLDLSGQVAVSGRQTEKQLSKLQKYECESSIDDSFFVSGGSHRKFPFEDVGDSTQHDWEGLDDMAFPQRRQQRFVPVFASAPKRNKSQGDLSSVTTQEWRQMFQVMRKLAAQSAPAPAEPESKRSKPLPAVVSVSTLVAKGKAAVQQRSETEEATATCAPGFAQSMFNSERFVSMFRTMWAASSDNLNDWGGSSLDPIPELTPDVEEAEMDFPRPSAPSLPSDEGRENSYLLEHHTYPSYDGSTTPLSQPLLPHRVRAARADSVLPIGVSDLVATGPPRQGNLAAIVICFLLIFSDLLLLTVNLVFSGLILAFSGCVLLVCLLISPCLKEKSFSLFARSLRFCGTFDKAWLSTVAGVSSSFQFHLQLQVLHAQQVLAMRPVRPLEYALPSIINFVYFLFCKPVLSAFTLVCIPLFHAFRIVCMLLCLDWLQRACEACTHAQKMLMFNAACTMLVRRPFELMGELITTQVTASTASRSGNYGATSTN